VKIEHRISATVALAIISATLSGVTSYYSGQQTVQKQIAEVREQYVKKDDLERHVQQPLQNVQDKIIDLNREQAVQNERLRQIQELLEQQKQQQQQPHRRATPSASPGAHP
jgi:TolA-binding protein